MRTGAHETALARVRSAADETAHALTHEREDDPIAVDVESTVSHLAVVGD